jgi:hypothetical protein
MTANLWALAREVTIGGLTRRSLNALVVLLMTLIAPARRRFEAYTTSECGELNNIAGTHRDRYGWEIYYAAIRSAIDGLSCFLCHYSRIKGSLRVYQPVIVLTYSPS